MDESVRNEVKNYFKRRRAEKNAETVERKKSKLVVPLYETASEPVTSYAKAAACEFEPVASGSGSGFRRVASGSGSVVSGSGFKPVASTSRTVASGLGSGSESRPVASEPKSRPVTSGSGSSSVAPGSGPIASNSIQNFRLLEPVLIPEEELLRQQTSYAEAKTRAIEEFENLEHLADQSVRQLFSGDKKTKTRHEIALELMTSLVNNNKNLPTGLISDFKIENVMRMQNNLVRLMDKPLKPPVIWTQSHSALFVTICVENCNFPTIGFEKDHIYFNCIAGSIPTPYEVIIPLFAVINPEKCKTSFNGIYPKFILQKSSRYRINWPRLTKKKVYRWLNDDLNRYEDENSFMEIRGSADEPSDEEFAKKRLLLQRESEEKNKNVTDSEFIFRSSEPPVIWAQRSSLIFITISVEDGQFHCINVTPKQISAYCVCGLNLKVYEVTIPLFKDIIPQKTIVKKSDNYVELYLQKVATEYWPNLTREKKDEDYHWLKVDLKKWKDEDDPNEVVAAYDGGMGENTDMSDMCITLGGDDNETSDVDSDGEMPALDCMSGDSEDSEASGDVILLAFDSDHYETDDEKILDCEDSDNEEKYREERRWPA